MLPFSNHEIKIHNMSLSVTQGKLSLSDKYRDIKKINSLQWDWNSSSIFTITSPLIDQTKILDFFHHTTTIWIQNHKYLQDKLSFEFLDHDQNINFMFDFKLNFEGWRRITRSYLYDMNKSNKIKKVVNIVKIQVKAPKKGSGSVYFEQWNFVQERKKRVTSLQMPSVSGYLSDQSYISAYNYKQDIDLINPNEQLQNSLIQIKQRLNRQLKKNPVKSSDITSAIKFYNDQNVIVNQNRIISRQRLTPAAIQTHLYALVIDFLNNATVSSFEMAKNLICIVDDSGYAGGSELIFGWYDTIKYFCAVLLIFPFLDKKMKQKIQFTLKWNTKIGQFWNANPVMGWDSDYVHLILLFTLGYIVICNQDVRQIFRQLTVLKRFLQRKSMPSAGKQGWIKIDGTSFHHFSHYNAYMYSFNTYTTVLFILSGTKFQINKQSYEIFRNAAYNLLIMCNKQQYANSLCGRHPFKTVNPMKKQYYKILAEVGGKILNQQFDQKIVGAYNRIWNDEKLFQSYPAEKFPIGFWQFNYSPVGIYRMDCWVATIKGMNSEFWGSQIYPNENRFGRYQSYGSVQIMYEGGLKKSGFSADGYDWNHPAGTTTKILTWNQLNPSIDRVDQKSFLNFAAGLRFNKTTDNLVGKYGMYSFNFTQNQITKTYDKTFTFKKSMFCFDGIIICLGSNITSQDTNHRIVTTIFQTSINQQIFQFILDQKIIDIFPYRNILKQGDCLIIVESTGYYINSTDPIQIEISKQTAPTQDNKINKTGNFALGYINHGIKPISHGYQYIIIPAITKQKIQAIKCQIKKQDKLYKIIRKDEICHIVYHICSNIYAYSIFKQNTKLEDITIVEVNKPCLIMVKKYNNIIQLSLVNPQILQNQNNKIIIKILGKYKLLSKTQQIQQKIYQQNNISQFVIITKFGNPIDLVVKKQSI